MVPSVAANATQFLSTHSCGVRLTEIIASSVEFIISIHALLWSATHERHAHKGVEPISIHALLWSATFKSVLLTYPSQYFYPRTPVECDNSCIIFRISRK